jgi:hypothetical protein
MVAPIALLDVNVLIALLDPQHVHHEPAHPQQPSLPQQPRWSGRGDAVASGNALPFRRLLKKPASCGRMERRY